ncbi:hypothetical protein HUA74_14005 [Myxococcus sp. CA051A]|uniref:hypothetical protein n=1 Tax=unclassified Myxococcus TaxID=2648731 RepID=UPI00157AA9E5|nr:MULTISPECIES: hypothetical protein [unclassified Myxococcus]NTX36236.1 hypothetical protein [Myxococcus sp. CA033]NTX61772.1 hypothetical protein [Myxococcus sp. CA051A]
MAGPLTAFLLSGLLAAGPGGFTFEGRQASARTEQPDAFFIQGPLPFTDLAESGRGSADLTVEDRVDAPEATYGDKASFFASFRLGATDYRVELSQAGFPPAQALAQAPSRPLPPPPPHTVAGGVLLNVPLYGNSGLGWSAMTRTHAAVAVWGVGSVWRNGRLLTDTAFVHVGALDAGAFADDDTHRMLRQARVGDAELVVLVWNLPPEAEPRGFLQFIFEDVAIQVDGVSVRSVAVVENTGHVTGDPYLLTPVPAGVYPGVPPPLPPAPVQQTGTGGSGLATSAAAGQEPSVVIPGGSTRVLVGGSDGQVVTEGGATLGTGANVLVAPREPEVTSGVSPITSTPNPPVNTSQVLPGTPVLGPSFAGDQTVISGTTAPGVNSTVSAFGTPANLSTTGSFSVPSLTAPSFDAFSGTAQVSPGIIGTAPPLNADSATPPAALLGAPAPLNAASAPPLLGSPTPLNAAPATGLPATPAPANAAPATGVGSTGAPAAAPAGTPAN